MQLGGETLRRDCFTLIFSFGIMVGFSWEQSFDAGIELLAEKFHGAWTYWCKLGLSLATAVVIFPAWKNYILPIVLSGHGVHEAEDNASDTARTRSGCENASFDSAPGPKGIRLPGMPMSNVTEGKHEPKRTGSSRLRKGGRACQSADSEATPLLNPRV